MNTLLRWIALVAILFLPLIWFVAAYSFAIKVPQAESAVALAPAACFLLLVAYLIKRQRFWRSGRGLIALPFATIGYGGLAIIFISLAVLAGH